MTTPFNEWIERANKITHELRLLVKNGIRYSVALMEPKKPKKKKIKAFKTKKWQIKGVFLYTFEIIDEKEIAQIIKNNPDEQALYDKVFDISTKETYNLLLSDKQYKALCNFINTNKIILGEAFYLQRKGLGLKTFYHFTAVK